MKANRVQLSPQAQEHLESYLEAVEAVLKQQKVPFEQRRGITDDLHDHVLELLSGSGLPVASRADMEAVLARLDPPESFRSAEFQGSASAATPPAGASLGATGGQVGLAAGHAGRSAPRAVPTILMVVAGAMIVQGILSILGLIDGAMSRRVDINPMLLGLPIGWGLLKLRPGWRICGIVVLWVSLAMLVVFFMLGVTGDRHATWKFFGARVVPFSVQGIAIFCALAGLTAWELWVLANSRVKAAFARPIT